MQSCVYKRLFSYSVRRMSVRVFHRMNEDENHGMEMPATLHHRFIKHLEDAVSPEKSSQYSRARSISKKLNVADLNTSGRSRVSDVPFIIDKIENLKRITNFWDLKRELDFIDAKICDLVDALSFDQILTLLNKLMEKFPEKLASLKFFSEGIGRLKIQLDPESISPEKIVNILFLVSLRKTEAAREVLWVLNHLTDLKKLSLIEKSIVSVATFKAGVKLPRKSIRVIEDTIHKSLELLIYEPGLFVCLLKALRLARPSREFSLGPISKRLLQHEESYQISIAVPILALYAEMLKPDEKIVQRLVSDSICDISRWGAASKGDRESQFFLFVRTKDVDRLLWATSRLNVRLSDTEFAEWDKFVEARLKLLENSPRDFANILLSLWMLRSPKCQEFVEYCFKNRVFEPLLNAMLEDQAKLNLLLECVRIEAPGVKIPTVFNVNIPQQAFKTCHELKAVNELMKCMGRHLALDNSQIECPIKGIRVYGISTNHSSLGRIHIDILNNVTCLKDTRKPTGLMSLKLRLVKKLGYFSILLENDGVIKVESMIATIEDSIKSELKKRRR